MDHRILSWNPGPWGHPLRPWKPEDPDYQEMARLLVLDGGAAEAVRALLAGDEPSDADVADFGRTNYQAYLAAYEPIFDLLPDRVHLTDDIRAMLAAGQRAFDDGGAEPTVEHR